MSAAPRIFRVPVVYVDFISLEYIITWCPYDLFIPKKIWSKNEKRLLTFKEILSSGAGRIQRTQDYEKLGLAPVDNTPEEIRAKNTSTLDSKAESSCRVMFTTDKRHVMPLKVEK